MDAFARVIVDRLAETLRRTVIVDHRPGAGGNVAAESVARAPADGRTILLAYDSVLTVNPFLYPRLPFDPETDLTPLAALGVYGLILVTHPSIEATNIGELVSWSKKRPVRFASGGNGAPSHLALEAFAKHIGLDFVHVPYKGAAPATNDVIGGHADAVFTTTSTVAGALRAGKLRAIGYSGRTRSPLASDVPTLIEGGMRDFEITIAYIAFLPAATPDPVAGQLYAALKEVMLRQDVRERLEQQDIVAVAMSPDETAQWIRRARGRWGPLVRSTGMKVD
jgi:tripartite-type tricarboxylate transporter receptor subunit TctC